MTMTVLQAELYGSVAADLPRVCDILDAQLASQDAYVQRLVRRATEHRGKMLRPALVLLSGQALGRRAEEHYALAAVVEMVHLASLVHDDVIDEADARRSMPSANRTMGNEGAVLLGDYIMSGAFRLCSSLNSHQASQLLASTCHVICQGELMQVSRRGNLELDEAEYLDIIGRKTAWLLRACGLFGAMFTDAPDHLARRLAEYGHNVGMAFQIADDILDLAGTEEEMGKTLGRDLDKGELTLPLIRYLNSANGSAREGMIAAIMDVQPEDLGRIRQLLLDSDCLGYCQQLARGYVERAKSCLIDLPDSLERDCLSAVAEFVLTRRC